jgi:excisionase family DNA binding protein
MATRTPRKKPKGTGEDVLDLAEAAAYLKVPVADLAELADAGGVPCRRIGAGWRFSRAALLAWLGEWPPTRTAPKPGTKEAILPVIGISKKFDDFEEQIALMRKYREEDCRHPDGTLSGPA